MEPPTPDPLDSLIGLARTQVLAQILDSDNYDLRLMGLLGFNGALIAADLAAKSVFGALWWSPLIWVSYL